METLSQMELRHTNEKLQHIQKCGGDRNALRIEHQRNLDALVGQEYGSIKRAKLLIKHSSELRELLAVNADLWSKMIARHKEELQAQSILCC